MGNIYTLLNFISQTYIDNINSLKILNTKVRSSAIDYYEKYKNLKKDFLKKRRELQSKTKEFEETTKNNVLDNQELKRDINDFRSETKYFKEKAQIEVSEDKQDINEIAEILDSLVQDVNIFEGLENNEALEVSNAMNSLLKEKNNYEYDTITLNTDELNQNERIEKSDDLLEELKIIIRGLYNKKKISQIDVKSKDNKIYSFDSKCAILKQKNDKIYGIRYIFNNLFFS